MPIFISREEESSGPYTFDEVRELLAEGSLLSADLAWHEGLEQWIPLSELVGQSTMPESVPLPSVPIVVDPVPTKQVTVVTGVKPRYRKELLIGICVGVSMLVIAGAVWFGFFRPDGSSQEGLRITHVGEPKDKESSKLGPSKTNATVVPVNPQPVVTNAPAGPVNLGGNAKPKPLSPKFLAMIMSHDANLDFYVINIGSDKGLKKGQKLTVFRNGKDIGEIEVTRVQPLVSIAVPDKAFPKPTSPFKLGDKVMGGFSKGP